MVMDDTEKPTEFYSLNGGIAWYVNYSSIYLFKTTTTKPGALCLPQGVQIGSDK